VGAGTTDLGGLVSAFHVAILKGSVRAQTLSMSMQTTGIFFPK
jgi:hypothetical protein